MKKIYSKPIKLLVLFSLVLSMVFSGFSFAAVDITTQSNSTYSCNSNIGYNAVIEGCDWGPVITKLILNVGTTVYASSVKKENFTTYVTRRNKNTGEIIMVTNYADGSQTESKGYRTVTKAFTSTANGAAKSCSNYITLELAYFPDDELCSPMHSFIDFSQFPDLVGNADWIKSEFDITGTIGSKNIAFDKDDFIKNIYVLGDKFDLNGSLDYQDSTYGTISMKYASYTPKSDKVKNPLIIWLQGGGQGGTDPSIPLYANKVVNFASDSMQKTFGGAYVLVPQIKTMWMDVGTGRYADKDGKTSMYTKALKQLIDDYVIAHPDVDKSRIYIGGASNGGFMTTKMVAEYPDYFAAAFPIAGAIYDQAYVDEKIANIKTTPMWLTHCQQDWVMSPAEQTVPLYNKLIAASAKNVHFSFPNIVMDTSGKYFMPDGSGTPYIYFPHASWIYALNNDPSLVDFDGSPVQIDGLNVTLMQWVAKQHK